MKYFNHYSGFINESLTETKIEALADYFGVSSKQISKTDNKWFEVFHDSKIFDICIFSWEELNIMIKPEVNAIISKLNVSKIEQQVCLFRAILRIKPDLLLNYFIDLKEFCEKEALIYYQKVKDEQNKHLIDYSHNIMSADNSKAIVKHIEFLCKMEYSDDLELYNFFLSYFDFEKFYNENIDIHFYNFLVYMCVKMRDKFKFVKVLSDRYFIIENEIKPL